MDLALLASLKFVFFFLKFLTSAPMGMYSPTFTPYYSPTISKCLITE